MKIKNNNIPIEKLSIQQLKVLCMHKKQETNPVSISKLKRPGLLALWLRWQSRPDVEVSGSATIVAPPKDLTQNIIETDPTVEDNHGDNTMIVDDNIMEVCDL